MGVKIGLTVLKRHGANNIPADSTHVNPANLYPRLTFAGLGTAEEIDEFLVGHAPKAAANARVVCDFDETVASDVAIVEIGRVPADVDAGFGAGALACETARGFVDVHHFPHGHAEALDGQKGRLHVYLGLYRVYGPV